MPAYKTLKSVVHNLAESFASTLNYDAHDYIMGHVVAAAWDSGAKSVSVDLLGGDVEDSPLATPVVRASLEAYSAKLTGYVDDAHSDLRFIAEATMEVTVDPTLKRPDRIHRSPESPYTCSVTIRDDRGKEYSYTSEGWWGPDEFQPKSARRPWWRLW